MSNNNKPPSDISLLIDRWYELKENISLLETKLEKCKIIAEDYMDNNNIDSISSDNTILTRKELSRLSVSKKDLPSDIFNKYAKECHYTAFYINKKGADGKKIRKSVKRSKSRNKGSSISKE